LVGMAGFTADVARAVVMALVVVLVDVIAGCGAVVGRAGCGVLAGIAPSGSGLVEGGLQGVVERAQPDLIADGDRARSTDQVCAGPALLGGDDRFEHAVDSRVE